MLRIRQNPAEIKVSDKILPLFRIKVYKKAGFLRLFSPDPPDDHEKADSGGIYFYKVEFTFTAD
ncbi:MAG: hypothetical protein UHU21_16120, partial [Lachnospiraceae bacterium]|nr:hypothetical protein [Lachnospiraceae bacterium]